MTARGAPVARRLFASTWPCVGTQLELDAASAHTAEPLSETATRSVFQQARRVVRACDPLLAHMLEFKLVRDGCRNYVNARVRKEIVHAVYTAREADVLFLFIPSQKLEPVVVVVAMHAAVGRVSRLTATQIEGLGRAVRGFEACCGTAATAFYYTPARERGSCTGAPAAQRAHSAHFHVKIDVPSDVFARLLPVTQPVAAGLAVLRDAAYLAHHRARVPLTWAQLVETLSAETREGR